MRGYMLSIWGRLRWREGMVCSVWRSRCHLFVSACMAVDVLECGVIVARDAVVLVDGQLLQLLNSDNGWWVESTCRVLGEQ